MQVTTVAIPFLQTAKAYFELTKPRITASVVASMAIGFFLASAGSVDFVMLFNALLGTWMIAGGTAAHNQYLERDLDKLMVRTSRRPLPMLRIEPIHALFFSLAMIFSGLIYLILSVNAVAGLVSLATSFIYLSFYTPLKRITFANVPIGAVAGALPPVGGWAAVSGDLSHPGMWLLFGFIFFWQIPHVVSIAWILKDDYEKAGFRMLPKNDTTGYDTAMYSITSLIMLLPVGFGMYMIGLTSVWGLIVVTAISIGFLFTGFKFLIDRTKVTGRTLMFASLGYLPAVWIVLFADYMFWG